MKNLFLTAVATVGLTAATMAQVPSYVPTNGLVGWWPFNGNANDESGNGNNGTVNGNVSLSVGYNGTSNSAYFWPNSNNSQNYINIGNLSQYLPGAISLSQWVYFDGATTGSRVISTGEMGISVYNDASNSVVLNCSYDPSGANIWPSSYQITKYTWHHVVYTSEGGTARLYINGVLTDSSNNSVTPSISNSDWNIGRKSIAAYDGFGGVIDNIGIWNRALTQQEITALYNGCQLAINTQPVSQSVNINNNTQFSVGSSDPNASYQWQTDLGVGFQNINSVGQYSGATTNTLTVSNVNMSNNNQPFRCIVSSGTCADTSDMAVLTVNNNASIDALSNDKLVTVYPNPAQNQLQVKTGIELMNASYSILDNTGRTVLTGQLTSESTVIELSGLSNGTYFLHVGDQLKESFKVVKNE